MTSWRGVAVVLALLVAGGTAAALGEVDEGVDFSAALETWGDVLRDADQLGLKLTRVSDAEEMVLGEALVDPWRPAVAAHPTEEYVAAVGQALVRRVRRPGVRYVFHVVDSPAVNAFALPGGQVFVTTGMLGFLESEAELAAVLGHEIAHVDLRHCVERFQYELALARVGLRDVGRYAEVFRRLAASGYSKYHELEADAQGLRWAIRRATIPRRGRRSSSGWAASGESRRPCDQGRLWASSARRWRPDWVPTFDLIRHQPSGPDDSNGSWPGTSASWRGVRCTSGSRISSAASRERSRSSRPSDERCRPRERRQRRWSLVRCLARHRRSNPRKHGEIGSHKFPTPPRADSATGMVVTPRPAGTMFLSEAA